MHITESARQEFINAPVGEQKAVLAYLQTHGGSTLRQLGGLSTALNEENPEWRGALFCSRLEAAADTYPELSGVGSMFERALSAQGVAA